MNAADRDRFERLEDVAYEHPPTEPSEVAGSAADIIPHREFRYHQCRVVGLPKPLRFRSLTLGEFRDITSAGVDEVALATAALVDSNGHNYATSDDIAAMQEADPRTWAHVLSVAIKHCLGGTLEDLVAEAEKN